MASNRQKGVRQQCYGENFEILQTCTSFFKCIFGFDT